MRLMSVGLARGELRSRLRSIDDDVADAELRDRQPVRIGQQSAPRTGIARSVLRLSGRTVCCDVRIMSRARVGSHT
jgi:hypothetical protein